MKNSQTLSTFQADGLTRRDFIKLCTMAAVYIGLPIGFGEKFAQAAASGERPPVIWLSAQQCSGCGITLFRSTHPTLSQLFFEQISMDYHEFLCAGSGTQAADSRIKSMTDNVGKYILVVEGSIPLKDGGIYCKIGGRTAVDLVTEAAVNALAVIAIGSCAAWGGIPSTDANLTDAKSVQHVLQSVATPVVNIPGCPPNPYNFLSTLLYFLTFKRWPELDATRRPKFAYQRLVHEQCERRSHFYAGRFAEKLDDDGHRKGYCLYRLGCKGQETYNNCPSLLFGDAGSRSWPVGIGHPCIGCSEKGVAFGACLFPPPWPQAGTAILSGRVVVSIGGHEDMAIKNANVNIEGTGFMAVTDASGNFVIENVSPGTYKLVVSATGLIPVRQEINLRADQTLQLPSFAMTILNQADLDSALEKWDIGRDGKIGLEEAIRALQQACRLRQN